MDSLFSNNNYFSVLIFELIILFIGQIYYSICKKSTFGSSICKILLMMSQFVIVFLLIQSLRYTNKDRNNLTENEKLTRNVVDISLLSIVSIIILWNMGVFFRNRSCNRYYR